MRQPNGCSTPAPISRRASSGSKKNSLKRKKKLSTDLFQPVLDVRVKKGEEHSTDQHLLVCIFALAKLTAPETNDHD